MGYNTSRPRHIAQSGKNAGQWVTCIANKCPLGGAHVEEQTFKEIQDWAGRRAAVDVTAQDYADYMSAVLAGRLEQDRRPMETLDEKRARVGGERVTKDPGARKKQPGTKFRESEAEANKKKNTVSETEYYRILFQDHPKALDLTLAQQKKLSAYLTATHGQWAPTANYTKRVENLEKILATDKVDSLKVPSTPAHGSFVTQAATPAEINRKRNLKADEIAAIRRIEGVGRSTGKRPQTGHGYRPIIPSVCQASDPSTCRYHGASQSQLQTLAGNLQAAEMAVKSKVLTRHAHAEKLFAQFPNLMKLAVDQKEKVYNIVVTEHGLTPEKAGERAALLLAFDSGEVLVPKGTVFTPKELQKKKVAPVKSTPKKPVAVKQKENQWGYVVDLIESNKPIANRQTTPQPMVNQIADYSPLNPDDATTKTLLNKLKTFKGERKAFGRVPTKSRIMEFMVHNQVIISGTFDEPVFKKLSVKKYASSLESQLNHASNNLDKFESYKKISLKEIENRMEKFMVNYERNESMEREIHDAFVESSKKELQTELFQKGYHDGNHLLRVSDASKASEIYALKREVAQLKQQDEFSLAGL